MVFTVHIWCGSLATTQASRFLDREAYLAIPGVYAWNDVGLTVGAI